MKLSIQIVEIPDSESVSQRQFYLDDEALQIGRDYSADINLPDSSKALSRKHITIKKNTKNQYVVIKKGKNETKLNDVKLGYISSDIAVAHYGVFINDDGKLDKEKTLSFRKENRKTS